MKAEEEREGVRILIFWIATLLFVCPQWTPETIPGLKVGANNSIQVALLSHHLLPPGAAFAGNWSEEAELRVELRSSDVGW